MADPAPYSPTHFSTSTIDFRDRRNRLKDRIDLHQVASDLGLSQPRPGRLFSCQDAGHRDQNRNPTLDIHPTEGFICHGGNHESPIRSGHGIELVEMVLVLAWPDSETWLIDRYAPDLQTSRPRPKLSIAKPVEDTPSVKLPAGQEVFQYSDDLLIIRLPGKRFQHWKADPNRPGYGWPGGWPKQNRPLYGIDRLADYSPECLLLIVEGEGTADQVNQAWTGFVTVSWSAGAGNWHLSDWSEVVDHEGLVIILADADPAGRKAASEIADHLLRSGRLARTLVDLPKGEIGQDGKESGIDLADWLTETEPACYPQLFDLIWDRLEEAELLPAKPVDQIEDDQDGQTVKTLAPGKHFLNGDKSILLENGRIYGQGLPEPIRLAFTRTRIRELTVEPPELEIRLGTEPIKEKEPFLNNSRPGILIPADPHAPAVLTGKQKVGKSSIVIKCLADNPELRTVILAGEGIDHLHRRLIDWHPRPGQVLFVSPPVPDQDGKATEAIARFDPDLVVVDPLITLIGRRSWKENEATTATRIKDLIHDLAGRPVPSVLVQHWNKNPDSVGSDRIRGSTGLSALAGIIYESRSAGFGQVAFTELDRRSGMKDMTGWKLNLSSGLLTRTSQEEQRASQIVESVETYSADLGRPVKVRDLTPAGLNITKAELISLADQGRIGLSPGYQKANPRFTAKNVEIVPEEIV